MRLPVKKVMAALGAVAIVVGAAVIGVAAPASAAPDPSFKVTCYPRAMAQNDPIVYPGQAGRSHMHSFYGAKGVDQNTTVDSLLAQSSSQCGSGFDTVDLSSYWVPTLYQNGQAVYTEYGMHQLRAYYQRAGGPGGAPVDQAFPRGLRMIAGDMHATTPQDNVTYVCANAQDTGSQRGGGHEFMSCNSDEVVIAKLVFPDCWDGVNLDSPNHKSHMAFSSGASATCPSDHPVKLPRLTFEAWYYGVNGDASSFNWASGGAYTFHGDVISAWDTRAAANLVNQCINVAFDCNPLEYSDIPQGDVTAAQINAQLTGTTPSPSQPAPSQPAPSQPAPSPSDGGSSGGGHHATPTPTPTPTATGTPLPTAHPSASPTATAAPGGSHEHGGGPVEAGAGTGNTPWPGLALGSGAIAIIVAFFTTFARMFWPRIFGRRRGF